MEARAGSESVRVGGSKQRWKKGTASDTDSHKKVQASQDEWMTAGELGKDMWAW